MSSRRSDILSLLDRRCVIGSTRPSVIGLMPGILSSLRGLPHNVVLYLWFSVASSFAQSIVLGSAFLSTYIFYLEGGGNSNDDVGYVSAVSGLVMLVLAVPLGKLTDAFRRDRILRLSCLLGLLASAIMCAALLYSSMPLLYAAAAAYGALNAASGPALSSIFADSIPSGSRTAIYSISYALSLAAGAAGPLVGVFFFLFLGNEWRTPPLRAIMLAGNALNAASVLMLWFFDDEKSLGQESEGAAAHLLSPDEQRQAATGATGATGAAGEQVDVEAAATATGGGVGRSRKGSSSTGEKQRLLPTRSRRNSDAESQAHAEVEAEVSSADKGKTASHGTQNLGHQRFGCLTVRSIPYVIFASDFVIATGAGMTVQFFSLYFSIDYALSPLAVAGIYAAAPLAIAAISTAAIPLSKRIGRAWAAVLCDAVGTACLFGMSFAGPLWLDLPLYLFRTAAMNAGYPLQRAILMDVVKKKERGLWNSLEGVTSFVWTGSAALGGILSDSHGYRWTFGVTGALYVAATLLLMLLIPLTAGEVTDVEVQEAGQADTDTPAADADATAYNDRTEQQEAAAVAVAVGSVEGVAAASRDAAAVAASVMQDTV